MIAVSEGGVMLHSRMIVIVLMMGGGSGHGMGMHDRVVAIEMRMRRRQEPTGRHGDGTEESEAAGKSCRNHVQRVCDWR